MILSRFNTLMKKNLLLLSLLAFCSLFAATPPASVKLCAACHGAEGISTHSSWPNLAGQHPAYLLKQLKDYKQNLRHSKLMARALTPLPEEEMHDLALYYAKMAKSQKRPAPPSKKGQNLYQRGDLSRRIIACTTCHGPAGKGNAQAGFPVLTGQNTLYTMEQLQAFKSRRRANDLGGVMQSICSNLSDEEIQALAGYIAHLPQ